MNDTIDTAAETEVTPVTFHSGASNYRVVVAPQRRRQLGESNEFEVVSGKDVQFYDGVYVSRDPEEIEWLRNYSSYGQYYWEVGSAEDRPESSAELQGEIIRLAMSGDFQTIADILVAERSALSRPEVIVACESALQAADRDLPARPEVPLHELQRVRMGPAAGITPGVSAEPVVGSPMVDPSTLAAPGVPAVPTEAPAVPTDQVPATGETTEGTSATMPNAEGPLAGGQAPPPVPPPSESEAPTEPPAADAGPPAVPAPGTE